jgi:murein DD-endopeptidase MepM/ murein hydrolase activator NlpD
LVVLQHDGGFQTVYMHLSKFAERQKVGMDVAQKTVIGYVGTTGLSTGPHLHFGVKRSGRWVDPATVRSIERPGVPAKHRARFERDTEAIAARLADALTATQ